jgi:hypothetical protein
MRGSLQPPGPGALPADRLRSRAPMSATRDCQRDAQTLCVAQIFVDSILNRAGSGPGRFRTWKALVRYINVAPSHLPSFLLPCPHCGHRMAVRAVAPALYSSGEASNDLEDVTHTCVQCGTRQISTRRPFSRHPRYRAPDLSPRIAFAKSAGRDECACLPSANE